jgi:polyphosphate kinase
MEYQFTETMADADLAEMSLTPPSLDDPILSISRELSWLEFNGRVLAEALDERNPLLERIKFIAIFSSNLDEYFMVRVSSIMQQLELGLQKRSADGLGPKEQLSAISHRLRPLLTTQTQGLRLNLLPPLAKEGIRICSFADIQSSLKHCEHIRHYFEEQVFPVLTPLAVDPSHPFPYISNLSLSLAVQVIDPESGKELFARIKVPSPVLPRLVPLETPNHFIPLEEVIAAHLDQLFPGMDILGCYPFRLTRNSDLELAEEEAEDLLLIIEESLRKRRLGDAVRLELTPTMPDHIRQRLIEELEIGPQDVYEIDGLLDLTCLWQLVSIDRPDLKAKPFIPRIPEAFQDCEDIFALIRNGDRLVHHPYDSFSSTVEAFVAAAADDPNVLTIKQTLYRTSGDSPIVHALIRAAENGKQVAVLVELKARFDERNNINWARILERAGVHVVYGLAGLKTHTKTTLVVRREADGLFRYVHIGTGNYNSKTAKLYTDLGLFSCREELGADLTDLFNYLTGYSRQTHYRKLLLAPTFMRDQFLARIEREIRQQTPTKPGRIIAKMNALVDPVLIKALYEASQAGVRIDLIIRGICCLRPGYPQVSENIRVYSVIGRLLEHSRVYYFGNGGNPEVLIGSADWMTRNLDRRVEVVVPVEQIHLRQQLTNYLDLLLLDNRQSWEMQNNGAYARRQPKPGEPEVSAQEILLEGCF